MRRKGRLVSKLREFRDKSLLGSGTALERLIGRLIRHIKPELSIEVMAEAGITRGMRILDVGCGAGHGINRLYRAGFRSISGIDRYVDGDRVTEAGALYRIALIRTQATVLVVIASKAKRSRILVSSPAVLDRHDRFAVSR